MTIRHTNFSRKVVISLLIVAMLWIPRVAPCAESSASLNAGAIEKLTGAKGTLDQLEAVFKVSVPRKDLSVVISGVKMTPPMGLTSWAAFKRKGTDDMVMGDLVLTPDQLSPVMDAALDNGLEVTGLHNHFVTESPRIMFMHIGGMGTERDLAAAVGKVFSTMRGKVNKSQELNARIDPAHSSLDTGKLDSALGLRGEYKGGVYKFVVGRKTRIHGLEVGNQMGVNTWGAFAGSDNEAVVDGDFAMREPELQSVLRALRRAGINIVAIHQHMVSEQPRIIFLHYWGVAPAADLAKGLRLALDLTQD